MPKSRRETLAAIIVLELLLKGIHFDSASIWRMPLDHNSINRTLQGLVEARVISKSPVKGRYRLTDEFRESMRTEITRDMPREIFIHYPDLTVFDLSGIGDWTEEELDTYIARLRERWQIRRRQADAREPG